MTTVTGTAGADNLIGTDANDTLNGLGGNDQLTGGKGADFLVGGSGTDTARYDGSAQGIAVNLLFNSASLGDAQGDRFREVENVTGSAFADQIVGNGADNVLKGLAGNDTLVGLGGDDTFVGGAGADRFQGDNGVDTADYGGSAQGVTVNLLFGTGSSGDAQGDTYETVENVAGSKFADQILGDGNANVLRGGGGDDHLFGLAGSDTLFGGKGVDTLEGDNGQDVFAFTRTDESAADREIGSDVIADFHQSQGDRINLSAIDADPSDAADDAFVFLGQSGEVFDAPGQLSFISSETSTIVLANTVGGSDSLAEMAILIDGQVDLTANDFVL
jgi:Ca2+-binding RTX toxin-like protein